MGSPESTCDIMQHYQRFRGCVSDPANVSSFLDINALDTEIYFKYVLRKTSFAPERGDKKLIKIIYNALKT